MSSPLRPWRVTERVRDDIVDAAKRVLFQPYGGKFRRRRTHTANPRTLLPFQVRDESNAEDGWQITLVPGLLFPLFAVGPAVGYDPEFGSNSVADEIPETVPYDETDVYLVVSTDANEDFDSVAVLMFNGASAAPENDFTTGYLLLATVTKAGTEENPSVTIEQYLTGNKAYRKVNLTHMWSSI